jgi:hypothetical protein
MDCFASLAMTVHRQSKDSMRAQNTARERTAAIVSGSKPVPFAQLQNKKQREMRHGPN